MISVLLVDDEILVKVGLKSLINWESQGFQIIAEAENGEQGVELCKKHHPDLIITDITMHPMDGLEMMREIKKFDSNVKFIVLSGYDEFQLVQQALRLGALDYQLKLHMSSESLSELLASVRPIFQNSSAKSSDEILDFQSRSVLQLDFLKSLIGGTFSDSEEIAKRKRAVGLSIHEKGLYLSVIYSDARSIVERYPAKDFKSFELMVLDTLRQIGGEFFDGYFFSWSLGVFVMIFSVSDREPPEETKEKIKDMDSVYQEMLQEYFGMDFSISTHGPCHGLENLRSEFEKTWLDAANRFEEAKSVSKLSETADGEPLQDFSADIALNDTLTHAFDGLDIPAVEDFFERIFQYITQVPSSQITMANSYCTQLVGFCDISLGSGFRSQCAENGIDINGLALLTGKENLLQWMKKYREEVLNYLNILMAHKNVLIENAKKYVLQNMGERIALNDVAEQLKISAGYLSSLFTKYEGIHFIDYVNQVKIKEAKKMLKTGNYKIYQVAYMLGYESSSYFSRIFKKVTGYAPKDMLY